MNQPRAKRVFGLFAISQIFHFEICFYFMLNCDRLCLPYCLRWISGL